ncbi:MAG: hypothetical protein A2144_02405 [Chloroflexi bacterium RBG_16_50_9]|nr:MAG: hypothetical protein A2144_02405 [Chloroflexi bacterium RBG_16_50_9]
MGFTTPPACATMAYRGIGPFGKKLKNLRAIISLPHNDRMLWAVPAKSKIHSVKDMEKEPLRLVIPDKNFPVRFAVEKILEAYGLSLNGLKNHGWQIIEESHCLKIPVLVMQGKADALVHEGMRTPAWLKLGRSGAMRFLPIDHSVLQKISVEYGYRKAVVPKGMFPGIDEDIPCVDFSDWLLFVRDDMPDDLAYLITKICIEKKREIFEFYFRGIPEGESNLVCPVDPKQVWRNIGEIPLHPAAERYYKEHGYM